MTPEEDKKLAQQVLRSLRRFERRMWWDRFREKYEPWLLKWAMRVAGTAFMLLAFWKWTPSILGVPLFIIGIAIVGDTLSSRWDSGGTYGGWWDNSDSGDGGG